MLWGEKQQHRLLELRMFRSKLRKYSTLHDQATCHQPQRSYQIAERELGVWPELFSIHWGWRVWERGLVVQRIPDVKDEMSSALSHDSASGCVAKRNAAIAAQIVLDSIQLWMYFLPTVMTRVSLSTTFLHLFLYTQVFTNLILF